MMRRGYNVLIALLFAATAGLMPVALYLIFIKAPEEKVMGAVQKIFYFHVPIAAVTFLSVFVLLAGAAGYLWTRRAVWDHLSIASAEVGLVFCTLVLITGPIWAKPAWGVWWTWEAKLTTTLILWLLLAGILLTRAPCSGAGRAGRVRARRRRRAGRADRLQGGRLVARQPPHRVRGREDQSVGPGHALRPDGVDVGVRAPLRAPGGRPHAAGGARGSSGRARRRRLEVAMKSYTFLFWGYLVVWAGLMTYLVVLGRKIAGVARRLDSLEARTKGGDGKRTT
jgi:CcmD family protein